MVKLNVVERLHRELGWQPVDPPRRPVVFVNPRAGGGKAEHVALSRRAAELGIEAIMLDPDHDLSALVAAAVARGADALGMAGGDGSLAVVAAAACEHDLPFACIPAGTRNHFALDVGVSRHDVVGALAAFTDGIERRIDVGEVNGHVFLNNVSIGVYADAVRRPGYRDEKLRTLLDTAREVLGSDAAAAGIEVTDERGRRHRDPAVALVSNNAYATGRGTRPRLDAGRLGIVVLARPHAPDHAWSAPSLEVAAHGTVDAARDGEPLTLDPPLRFSIRPRALRVRISAEHPGVSPAGLMAQHPGRRQAPSGG